MLCVCVGDVMDVVFSACKLYCEAWSCRLQSRSHNCVVGKH